MRANDFRTTTAALREFEAAVDGIGWLWRMCAADLVVALHGKMRARDLVVDRDPPWLPVDRGRRPARFLDDLVRTGHADPPQAEADALRRHYAEAVVRG